MDDTPQRSGDGDATVTDLRSPERGLYVWQVSRIGDGARLVGGAAATLRRATNAMTGALREAHAGGHIPLGWVIAIPTDRPVYHDEAAPVAVLATVDPESGVVIVHDV